MCNYPCASVQVPACLVQLSGYQAPQACSPNKQQNPLHDAASIGAHVVLMVHVQSQTDRHYPFWGQAFQSQNPVAWERGLLLWQLQRLQLTSRHLSASSLADSVSSPMLLGSPAHLTTCLGPVCFLKRRVSQRRSA